ncbi:MAG: 4'-phosphopantetheinyl transferase family protein [Thermoanaerobaculia bacterium]
MTGAKRLSDRPPEPQKAVSASRWLAPPAELRLDPSQVHLWLLDSRDLGPARERLGQTLDEEERLRAGRYRFPRDRDRFILFRGTLRALLGRYLGIAAEAVRFGQNREEKPFVVPRTDAEERLQFNLSHSEDLALLAVAAGRRVGVDIERVRSDRAAPEVARRFFSEDEADALREIPESARSEAFFSCWTRKEAYIKARGGGLSIPLKSFTVSLAPGSVPSLLRSHLGEGEVARWSILDPGPPAGYAAALAVEGRGWVLRRWLCSKELLPGV